MKILVFTSLYPNNIWPNHGVFVKERMSEVARLKNCDVQVVAPVPYYPDIRLGWRTSYAQVVRKEIIDGVCVYHPRYLMIPKVGMAVHGLMMFLSVLWFIRKMRGGFDFDIIDAHYLYPDGFAAVLLGRFLGKPVVVSARGSDINVFPQFPLIRRLLKHMLCNANKIIAVSRALKDGMVELGVSQEKIAVIPNGVDAKKFYPTVKSDARSQLGLPAEQKLILSVGGLVPVKGFDLLIRAFRLVIDASPGNEPRLFIIGEGRSRKEIEQVIAALNLSSHVQVVGSVPHSELHLWYSAADLFCLASEREGWPNVLLESLACGTPVVAPPVGGIPEIINSENLGFLAERNEYEIAGKIRLALDRTWNAKEIVAHAREHAWDKAALNTIGVFESVLSKDESGDRRVSNEVLAKKDFFPRARLKVLFVSQPFLYPMDTGGRIRTGKLLEKLKDIFDIALVSNFESARHQKYLSEIKQLCSEFHPVPWKETPKYTFRFYIRLLARMLSRYPITVINDYSKALESAILKLVRRSHYDLVICDFLHPSLNFRKLEGYPSVLFEHNIESVLPKRHFEVSTSLLMKAFWKSQWRKMERYETEACRRFSAVIAVSEVDKKILQDQYGAQNVFAIPTGVDTRYFSPREDPVKKNSLVFTGSMDWLPNEDAIIFFAKEILGKIKQKVPDITLTVVGRNPSRRLLKETKHYPEIRVIGWVSDVRPSISSHSLYVIPLRIGGGTRIKAYEALAMGKAVVSTRIGVEGLPVRDGDHLVLADEPEEFAAAVTRLLADAEHRKRIERNARSFVETRFSWDTVAEVFSDICREVAAETCPEKIMPAIGAVESVQQLHGSTCETFVSGR